MCECVLCVYVLIVGGRVSAIFVFLFFPAITLLSSISFRLARKSEIFAGQRTIISGCRITKPHFGIYQLLVVCLELLFVFNDGGRGLYCQYRRRCQISFSRRFR